MLSQNTVTKFLSSAAVNMGKAEYASVRATLKAVPGLEAIVTEAEGVVRTKARNKIVRKISAVEHAIDKCVDAADATRRAIHVHENAIQHYNQRIERAEEAANRRRNRVYMLSDKKDAAVRDRRALCDELAAFDADEN